MRYSTFEMELLNSTIGHLHSTYKHFEDYNDRYLKAFAHIQTLGLYLSKRTQSKYAALATAEFENRYSNIYIDLQQSTDCLLCIRHRMTGETRFVPLNIIANSI